jgi:hypothetical protein
MSVKTVDKDWGHLFAPFREKLRRVLDEVSEATGDTWLLVEGLRSAERQTHLWHQGRTRPGKIVTWLRTPRLHGAGVAGDCMPKKRGYNAPMAWWERYRAIYHRHGLANPAWGNGDLGHCELSDPTIRAKALVWVRAGFPATPPPPPQKTEIRVIAAGEWIEDAGAVIEAGRVLCLLRPVTDALDLVIAQVKGSGTSRIATIVDDTHRREVPVLLRGGRAFAFARDLPAKCHWDSKTQTLRLEPLPESSW